MKKLVLTLTAVAGLAVASIAQDFGFQKQDFIVEGFFQSSHENNRNNEIKVNSLNFSPQVGYFVSDKIAVGVFVNAGNEKTTDYSGDNDTYERATSFGGGVFGRYYFLDLGARFKTYAQLSAGLGSSRASENDGTTTTKGDKTNYFGADAGIGINYFVTPNIAINFGLSNILAYQTAKVDVESAESVSGFSANVNVFENFFDTARFGLTFKF
ncbi:outer membrane protein [Parapedobacter deserti]|uniref:Outer membrane protein n=1 Tax=Parapedobacter deserti TaxID=1912957 RepID=A0ABV7JTC5_9SPHI